MNATMPMHRAVVEIPRQAFEVFKAERGDRADAMVRLGFVKIVEKSENKNVNETM
jgi:hypothetical protein